MPKFYATGTRKVTTEEVDDKGKLVKETYIANVMIEVDPQNLGVSRAVAQNQVNRIAKRDKITLDGYGIRMVKGTNRDGSTLTKNAKKRKLEITKKHEANRRKNLLKKQA